MSRCLIAALFVFFCLGCGSDDLADGIPDDLSGKKIHEDDYKSGSEHGQEFLKELSSCNKCHGDDLTGGISEVSCDSCHKGWQDNCGFCHGSIERPSALSGKHKLHLDEKLTCYSCHNDVIKEDLSFKDATLHKNGKKDIKLSMGKYDPEKKSCSETCHQTMSW